MAVTRRNSLRCCGAQSVGRDEGHGARPRPVAGLLLFLLADTSYAADAIQEARRLWLRGSYAQAQARFEALVKEATPSPLAFLGLSRCLESRGEYDQALSVVDSALKDRPKDGRLKARQAELLHLRGRWDGGVKLNYFGDVVSGTWTQLDDPTAPPQRYDPRLTVDLHAGFELRPGIRLTVGGANVFDEQPTEQDPNETENGALWENVQMGFNGAYWFSRLSYRVPGS